MFFRALIFLLTVNIKLNVYTKCSQERRDGVIESCLYVNHVTSDSFRRFTIIAENSVAIGRQQTVLTERKPSTALLSRIRDVG